MYKTLKLTEPLTLGKLREIINDFSKFPDNSIITIGIDVYDKNVDDSGRIIESTVKCIIGDSNEESSEITFYNC